MKEVAELIVQTSREEELVDITARVEEAVGQSGVGDGMCWVFVPHTTCGVAISEHADPSVARDLLRALDRMVPAGAGYEHEEGNSPAHVKSALVGPSQAALVRGGRLRLGAWQGIFLCEFDGPRTRKVWVRVTGT